MNLDSEGGQPCLSVVIPTYNRANLVLRALQSVFDQTKTVDEVLLVDDGSTDDTERQVKSRFPGRVRYLRQENSGVSASRNRGMRESRGRFIAFLDSDDVWMPEKVHAQLHFLEHHPHFGMVLCDVERVTEDDEAIDVLRRRSVLPVDGMILAHVLRNPALVPASAMIRREVFTTVGGFDESLRTAEDLDFHLRVAMRWPIGVIEQSLVRAVRGHGGLSAASSAYDDYVRVYRQFVQLAHGQLPQRELDQALATAYLRSARGATMTSRWRDAARDCGRAMATAPRLATVRQALSLLPIALRRMLPHAQAR